MRVYLPGTFRVLAELRERGELAVPEGYAVTAALRDRLGGEDDEELLAYEAFRRAADASLALLGADPDAPRRRVVISVDAPAPADGADPDGRVRLTGPVRLSAVAAIHVDSPAAAADLASSDPAAAEHELEWYDVSELAQLLA